MAGNRIQVFFGDDLEDTWDSLRSVPGAFGNILIGVIRQVRLIDAVAFGVVILGLCWLVIGSLMGERSIGFYVVGLLPMTLWLIAGTAGGLVFHLGAIGRSSLAYWETYVLLLLFAAFGVVSLRLALDPRDRRVYRAPPAA